jgi:methylenetetrahydrofolate dehydrogenase (NADP+)/methenyltetrahydrofolate cyclohydrolase
MTIIDGKKIAGRIIADLKKLPLPSKKLTAVFVGDSPASESFLRQKRKISEELGVKFDLRQLPVSVSEGELIVEIGKIGRDAAVGGIIVQLPLPEKFNREAVIAAMDPAKDIDALSPAPQVLPLAVEVVRDILHTSYFILHTSVVGVVGRGLLIGRPIAEWLSGKCREVIIFHTGTDLERLKDCDLVITGVGKAGLLKPEMLKVGAGVIDFGFAMEDGKIMGDLDASRLTPHVSRLAFYTPTPGGTGPILVAEIFKNFYRLNSNISTFNTLHY